ncbi:MAG: anaerobic ribonucleoside-triphosphate reductase [Syntrophales bacterium]|nr:anaerobic ribonucleoside-triphosphate reductase [Syntrophales bacterium]
MNRETTDLTLFVRRTEEEIAAWDRNQIVEALIRETGISRKIAEDVSREVERQIFSSGISLLTSQLIRELVNAKLIERGLEDAVRRHARLGFPLYDVENFILHPNRERASVPHGPEGTNMILAEGIKRDYALNHVFSPSVAEAHIKGDIHLHDLGFIDRLVSVHDSLVQLKRTGLDFPMALTVAKPARHAEVLLAHLIRFTALLRTYVSSFVSWEGVNISFAPYIEGMDDREITQFAQMFVYEFSQLPAATGGQAMSTDIHLYWDIPEEMSAWPMIGPGGQETGRTCSTYLDASRRLVRAFIKVYLEGDAGGRPFIFPRPVFHISRALTDGEDRVFLREVSELAIEKGNPCFFFERKEDGFIRPPCPHFIAHNGAINLPRLGYRAKGEDEKLSSCLKEVVDVVVTSHLDKKRFIERLISYGEEGPFAFLLRKMLQGPYLNLENAFFVTGLVGLNELTHIHCGAPAHTSFSQTEFALSIVRKIREELEKGGRKTGVKLMLGQLPAEALAHRFARLDLRFYSPESGRFIKGDLSRGEIYYTDTSFFPPEANVAAMKRLKAEGEFHAFVEKGATCYIWLGNDRLSVNEVEDLILHAFRETRCKELVLAPDFTLCQECGQSLRGRWSSCPACGTAQVDVMSIITQYFSRVSRWNKGKVAELKDRFRYQSLLNP